MSDGFSPPEGVRAAARRGLELRRKFGRGGTLVGVARARDLSNGKSISASTIKRMVSFFARHAVDKRPNWSDPSKPTNGYIAHMLWGGDAGRSWANKVSRSIDAKKSVTEKHLPGKHNQRTHGRRGYGSSRGDGMSAEAFVAESTRLGDQTQRELDGIAQATPRQWSFEDENAFIDGVTADKPADYLDQQTVRESISRWSVRARQEGLTPEQALRAWNIAISQQGNTDTPSELTDMTVLLTTIKIQDLHHERAVAVSRMSYAEQDAAYDLVRARIDSKRDARDALRMSGVGVFDMPYDPELVSDCEAIMALALYGNPDLRLRAVAYGTNGDSYPFGEGGMPITVRREKVNSAGRRVPVDIAKHQSSISGGIEYYSLDYRLHITSFDTNQYGERTALSEKRHQEEFIQSFTKTHTTQNTSNVLGAAIQTAMSQVGPNRESSAQSLYPKGIKPPEPHPTVVKFLQNRYEQTQREYAQRGIADVQLYRGTRRGPINGIPMSPWSDEQKVANNFTGGDFLAGTPGYKPTLNRAPNMPVKYVFMHHGQSDFVTAFTENEFLILETTALRRGRIIKRVKTGNYGRIDDVTWSIKQLQAPNPYDQADGIVDYSLVSLYEPQYDIFYNYREKSSKSKVKKKHLPGKHDQRTHGRRGRAGTAFANTYVSARQDGKTHQQALSEAKTAAEQVRQQMREEKRYWEGRLQQDDVTKPIPARVPIDQATNIRSYSPEEIADYIGRRFDEIGPRALARLTPEERRAEQEAKDAYTAWNDYASSIEKQGRAPTPPELIAINELYRVQRLAAQRAQAVRERIQQYETDESYAAHMEVLTKMRHPTDPWISATKDMPHNPKLQPAGQDNRQEVESLIDATFAMFPQPRELDPVTGTRTVNSQYQYLIEPTARRAGFTYGNGKNGSMTYPYARSEYQFSTTVHETLHAVQYSRSINNPLNRDLGNWAVGRVGNEKVKSMNRMTKGRSYKPWELGYTDKVDDPYTLKRRVVSGLWVQGVRGDRVLDTSWRAQGFMEVLPQAFTDLRRASQRKDKELLVVAIQAVLNTTDEGG